MLLISFSTGVCCSCLLEDSLSVIITDILFGTVSSRSDGTKGE